MAHKLPDEILKEILLPVLRVPDAVFADNAHTSPFAFPVQSSSSVLVVCKRWLRVATPLLYNVVILRSTAQAQALALVLQANPDFGAFIRKLRVEGGFGVAMYWIIGSAPNITHLFLSLLIYSVDSVSGLCRALPATNPTHVILHDAKSLDNNHVRRLVAILLTKKAFSFPYEHTDRGHTGRLIVDALCKAQHLEVVYAPLTPFFPSYISQLSRISSVKRIEMTDSHCPRGSAGRFIKRVNEDPRLQAIITYQEKEILDHGITFTQRGGTLFVPMESAPEPVRNRIWSFVMENALHRMGDDLPLRRPMALRALPLVSKAFNKLVTPIMYTHPVLPDLASIGAFAARIAQEPSLGLHVRTLTIWHVRSYMAPEDTQTGAMTVILSRTPNLVRLHGTEQVDHRIPTSLLEWEGFEELAATAGSTLLSFNRMPIIPPLHPQSPSLFDNFTRLRSLDWGGTKFEFDPDRISPTCLSTLESICFRSYDPSSMVLLSRMDLPSLKAVTFLAPLTAVQPFLEKHGPKLLDLRVENFDSTVPVLDLCPNVSLLTFLSCHTIPKSNWLQCEFEHKDLRKIVVENRYISCARKLQSQARSAWALFFRDVDWTPFPALCEFQVDEVIWPLTEREIAKDMWHLWAEEMKSSITLVGRNGKTWKPRLQRARH